MVACVLGWFCSKAFRLVRTLLCYNFVAFFIDFDKNEVFECFELGFLNFYILSGVRRELRFTRRDPARHKSLARQFWNYEACPTMSTPELTKSGPRSPSSQKCEKWARFCLFFTRVLEASFFLTFKDLCQHFCARGHLLCCLFFLWLRVFGVRFRGEAFGFVRGICSVDASVRKNRL